MARVPEVNFPNLPSPNLNLDLEFSFGYEEDSVDRMIKKVFRSVLGSRR